MPALEYFPLKHPQYPPKSPSLLVLHIQPGGRDELSGRCTKEGVLDRISQLDKRSYQIPRYMRPSSEAWTWGSQRGLQMSLTSHSLTPSMRFTVIHTALVSSGPAGKPGLVKVMLTSTW